MLLGSMYINFMTLFGAADYQIAYSYNTFECGIIQKMCSYFTTPNEILALQTECGNMGAVPYWPSTVLCPLFSVSPTVEVKCIRTAF